MSTPQEYWDACLIRAWRNFHTFYDLDKMFHSIVGKWPNEVEPPLLRRSKAFLPKRMTVRYFTARFLPKINDRLLEQPPEKDVALLKKLKDSKYDVLSSSTAAAMATEEEKSRAKMFHTGAAVRMLVAHNLKVYQERNEATDWNKTKGPVKRRRAR